MASETPTQTPNTGSSNRLTQLSATLALVISAMALAVGAYQTRIMQTQARASVWPYLMVGSNYFDADEKKSFDLFVRNDGVGLARVRSVTASLDGKPLRQWDELVKQVWADRSTNAPHVTVSRLGKAVIPPNTNRETDIVALHTEDAELGKALFDAQGRLKIAICYCSIYDECWIARWRVNDNEPIASCKSSRNEFDF